MGQGRLQLSIARDNGLPEDTVTNTWYVTDQVSSSFGTVSAEPCSDALLTFYVNMQSWFASILTGTLSVKAYDMSDTEPRAPVWEDTASWSPGSTSLPAELACCLSFRGASVSGEPMARRRGRVYLGPLSEGALGTVSTSDRPVSSSLFAAVDTHYATMVTAWGAVGSGYEHCVYSPTTDASQTITASCIPVELAWMDNAWDVQRRRGAKATSRTTVWP
jgi:hypothetical protein